MMGQLQLTNLNLSLGNHLGLTHTIIYFGCPIKAAVLTTPVHIENLPAPNHSQQVRNQIITVVVRWCGSMKCMMYEKMKTCIYGSTSHRSVTSEGNATEEEK